MKPFDKFVEDALKNFEQHLRTIGIDGARDQRMWGGREFAWFLVCRPHQKGEVTKGRPISN